MPIANEKALIALIAFSGKNRRPQAVLSLLPLQLFEGTLPELIQVRIDRQKDLPAPGWTRLRHKD